MGAGLHRDFVITKIITNKNGVITKLFVTDECIMSAKFVEGIWQFVFESLAFIFCLVLFFVIVIVQRPCISMFKV